jgi:hypothetical protein
MYQASTVPRQGSAASALTSPPFLAKKTCGNMTRFIWKGFKSQKEQRGRQLEEEGDVASYLLLVEGC